MKAVGEQDGGALLRASGAPRRRCHPGAFGQLKFLTNARSGASVSLLERKEKERDVDQ
jgi:hypothetical protein